VIGGVALPLSGKKLELTGTLDKVEFISDSEVSVVDYKTGEPRSRNELLGKTKQADGNYYRQLVFYKLLIGGLRKKGWRMKTGAIDFLKPAKGGGYRREVFEIADDEVVTLKKQIQSAAESILNLSFFDRGCGKKECEYCRLHQALR
jgi:DNA helicase-2/ATP-dependent DNA helicase PcrA